MDAVQKYIDQQLAEGALEVVDGDDGVTRYRPSEATKLRTDHAIMHAAMSRAREGLAQALQVLEWADAIVHDEPKLLTMEELREAVKPIVPVEEPEHQKAKLDRGYL